MVALADFASVSSAHLYDVLACRKSATIDFIAKVAQGLGCPPADLLRDPPDVDSGDPATLNQGAAAGIVRRPRQRLRGVK